MIDATPVHPLRQRLIDDMTLRGLNTASQRTYIRAVRACCAHLGVGPGALTADDVRAFLLHLQKRGLSPATINTHATALRLFVRTALGRSADVDRAPILRVRRALPSILTPQEVARIIAAAPGIKYRTALSVTYGAGLRASETASLNRLNQRMARRGSVGTPLSFRRPTKTNHAGRALSATPLNFSAQA